MIEAARPAGDMIVTTCSRAAFFAGIADSGGAAAGPGDPPTRLKDVAPRRGHRGRRPLT